ncbi:hypothetical protein PF002_g28687 [Phytophthora fragariae]|uniref:Uncharacterized protein n=1 Tax=Phytophthora fragariae TaxID=53985 RepID=A0A6A3W0J3_9STRA|nr:hypothetical protein PF002_g28687 [Phytophthora fragariae]
MKTPLMVKSMFLWDFQSTSRRVPVMTNRKSQKDGILLWHRRSPIHGIGSLKFSCTSEVVDKGISLYLAHTPSSAAHRCARPSEHLTRGLDARRNDPLIAFHLAFLLYPEIKQPYPTAFVQKTLGFVISIKISALFLNFFLPSSATSVTERTSPSPP